MYRYQTCHCPPCPSPTSSWFTEPIAVTKLSWTSVVMMVPSNMITAPPPWLLWKNTINIIDPYTEDSWMIYLFIYLRKIFSFHSPEMTNCALWTFCSNVLFLSMKDVMNLNDVDCWHCHSSTCQQSIVVATPDCDTAPRLSLQTPGLYIPHVLKLFLFFVISSVEDCCWDPEKQQFTGFVKLTNSGLSITIGNHVFVITFKSKLVQPPSHPSLFSSLKHFPGPLHYCWITLQKPIWKSVTCKVRT